MRWGCLGAVVIIAPCWICHKTSSNGLIKLLIVQQCFFHSRVNVYHVGYFQTDEIYVFFLKDKYLMK